jgi:NTE family protein
MKYSLCLGWWAARWLAHIWVLKYLEENNIECDEISWTSMWAIIWACYAIWMNFDEITIFAKNINILKMIDLNFKKWILNWNKVYKVLYEKFWDKKIEDCNKKLYIIATNINTWEKTIFNKWKIVDVLRASFSLPSVFTPYQIWEEEYVDWWITCNLPIEVLKWKNIIAVSALKNINWKLKMTNKFFWFNLPKTFFEITYQILHKTVLIMMAQNENLSINTKWKKIILIKPDFWDLDYYSFNKVEEMIDVWYKEAKKILINT